MCGAFAGVVLVLELRRGHGVTVRTAMLCRGGIGATFAIGLACVRRVFPKIVNACLREFAIECHCTVF